MNSEALTTYLNDHLAGSVAALELLEHLIELHRGTPRESFFTALRTEVQQDQGVVRDLLRKAGAKESRVRRAAAWLTEKLGQAKLKLDDPGTGELEMLEALETLGLGIQGKLALWKALAAASANLPLIRHLNLASLQQRAEQQFDRVEKLRLHMARVALSS